MPDALQRDSERVDAAPTQVRLPVNTGPGGVSCCVFEPPSREDIMRLRASAELTDPPMVTMPGVEAWSPELTRRQVLAETFSESGPQRAVLELRYIAARYGPPEIRALAKADQLPGDPRGPQF